jgi:hypothetical protein
MAIELHADTELTWTDATTGRDFALFIGNDEGLGGFEVLLGSATEPPTHTQLKDLHLTRLNKRSADLVVGVQFGESMWLFGPEKDRSTVVLKASDAARALQACLNEPDTLAAYKRYVAILDAHSSTDMPGVRNRGLFANHHIRENVPQRKDWPDLIEAARPLTRLRHRQLIAGLGFSIAEETSDAFVLCNPNDEKRAVAILLDGDEAFENSSSRFPSSPVATGLAVAQKFGVPWLIVLRGEQIRLYPGRDGVGVGQKGQVETYMELDLAMLDQTHLGLLPLVFSAESLSEGGATQLLLKESSQYAAGLGERLRSRVYEKVVPYISTSVAEQLRDHGIELDAAGLQQAYSITLKLLFRLLFQAYAEDRGLLPAGRNERYDANSLKTIAQRDKDTPIEMFSSAATIWNDLIQVWDAIDEGSTLWQVPAYNGGLFGSDPEAHPEGHLIRSLRLPDSVLGPALQGLLIDLTDEGVQGPVDFRSLSVREFGTIYEGLLESSLSLAPEDLTFDSSGSWVPAKPGDPVAVPLGNPYFHSSSGERKTTGSYFTRKFIVDHLVQRAIGPTIDAHLERIRSYILAGDDAAASANFFDYRVADLAMGSGHFLVAAVDHIESKMRAFLADPSTRVVGIVDELSRLRAAAREALGRDEAAIEEIEDASLLRRQIARRCVYGLDINPLAVELARLALWIHTFVPGLPMSSLDHGLVCGNSLTGIGSIDEATMALEPNRKDGHPSFFDGVIESSLFKSVGLLIDAANASEANKAEVANTRELAQRAKLAAEPTRQIFDVAVAARMGQANTANAFTEADLLSISQAPEVRELADLARGAHMPYLFPEVFLRENGGFDALIGNPPFEKVTMDEQRWWGLHLPGVRALPSKKKADAIKAFQELRPDLLAQYEVEAQTVKFYRDCLFSGNFPGMSSGGNPDLSTCFSWRNWQLLRDGGRAGIVLPRTALAASALTQWRAEVLRDGSFIDVCFLNNHKSWAFEGVDERYTFALTVLEKGSDEEVRYCGPLGSESDLNQSSNSLLSIPKDEFGRWTAIQSFPLLPTKKAMEAFRQMKLSPNFSDGSSEVELRGYVELNATTDKPLLDFDLEESRGRRPVYGGASFNIWDVDFKGAWAYVRDEQKFRETMSAKFRRASTNKASVYNGLTMQDGELPLDRARVAYRWITRPTDTRTTIVCLIPPGTPVVNSAPLVIARRGGARAEAFALGVMSSMPFDWSSRRLVEVNFTFEILNDLPMPYQHFSSDLGQRCIEISGRLAAVDHRFEDWANDVGVPVASVSSATEKEDLVFELDAVVAHMYGLDREQLTNIFVSFHRGWDYQSRLDQVLAHFDRWADNK